VFVKTGAELEKISAAPADPAITKLLAAVLLIVTLLVGATEVPPPMVIEPLFVKMKPEPFAAVEIVNPVGDALVPEGFDTVIADAPVPTIIELCPS
jgi:hypothetical protein